MAGPTYYPPANRTAQWFGDAYPGTAYPKVEKVVLHSTEGTGWPGYNDGASAPHLTVMGDFDKKRLIWRQHFHLLRNSRALRNESGGVQTNLDGAVQIEIVGTCDRTFATRYPSAAKTPHLQMWNLPDWAIQGLGDFIWFMHDEHGVPLNVPALWPAYPSSPTLDNQVRMSGPEWNAFRGICGHLHVPENTHLDPGNIPIGEILKAARGEDMSVSDAKAGALEALKTNIAKNTNGPTPDVPTISVADFLEWGDRKHDDILTLLSAVLAEVQAIRAEQVAIAERVAVLDTSGIDQTISAGTARLAHRLEQLEIRITDPGA